MKFQFQFLFSQENGFLKPHHAFRRRNLRLRRSTSATTTCLCLCLRSNSPSNSVSSPNSLSPIHCFHVFSLNFNGFCCRSSLQKYAPLDWSAYFDREDDIRIKDTENVSLSLSNWCTVYSNTKSLFCVCVCVCNFRYFMYIWREQKALWFFVYMEVAILGMSLLSF